MQNSNSATPPFKKDEALAAAQAGKLERNVLLAIIDNSTRFGLTAEDIEVFRAALGRKTRRVARMAERERKRPAKSTTQNLRPVLWSSKQSESEYAREQRSDKHATDNAEDYDSSDEFSDNDF